MTPNITDRTEAESIIQICECGKKTPICGTTEICVTWLRKLNPLQFRGTLQELLDTWTSNRPDIDIEEFHSLCPAIGSMIRIDSRRKEDAKLGNPV